jgi:hypothetical protein
VAQAVFLALPLRSEKGKLREQNARGAFLVVAQAVLLAFAFSITTD